MSCFDTIADVEQDGDFEYAQVALNMPCPELTPADEAKADNLARAKLILYGTTWCENAAETNCERPKSCKPTLSDMKRVGRPRRSSFVKDGKKICVVSTTVKANILCECK